MKKMYQKCVKKIYAWGTKQVKSPYALWILAIVAFAESSFFPIPPDILLIPLVLYRSKEAFKIATVAMVCSVLGGCFGYAIGYFLYNSVGIPVLNFYHYRPAFERFCEKYNTYGAWIVFGAGITPFPYKIITIASGVTHLNFGVFTVASILARGLRFYLIAVLLWAFGEPMQRFIEKNLGWLSVVFLALLIGGFLLVGLF